MAGNVFGLGEGGDFITNVDAGNQTLINYKCVCGALKNDSLSKSVGRVYQGNHD